MYISLLFFLEILRVNVGVGCGEFFDKDLSGCMFPWKIKKMAVFHRKRMNCNRVSYHIYHKYWDRQASANSVDPEQMHLIRATSCVLCHWGVQLILAYSWARPAILVAGKGRGGVFLFLLFLHFHSFSSFFPVPLSSHLLSLLSLFSLPLGDDTK